MMHNLSFRSCYKTWSIAIGRTRLRYHNILLPTLRRFAFTRFDIGARTAVARKHFFLCSHICMCSQEGKKHCHTLTLGKQVCEAKKTWMGQWILWITRKARLLYECAGGAHLPQKTDLTTEWASQCFYTEEFSLIIAFFTTSLTFIPHWLTSTTQINLHFRLQCITNIHVIGKPNAPLDLIWNLASFGIAKLAITPRQWREKAI